MTTIRRYVFKDVQDAQAMHSLMRMDYGLTVRKEGGTLTVDVSKLEQEILHELDDQAVEICSSQDEDAVLLSEITTDDLAHPSDAVSEEPVTERVEKIDPFASRLSDQQKRGYQSIFEGILRDLRYLSSLHAKREAFDATMRRMDLNPHARDILSSLFSLYEDRMTNAALPLGGDADAHLLRVIRVDEDALARLDGIESDHGPPPALDGVSDIDTKAGSGTEGVRSPKPGMNSRVTARKVHVPRPGTLPAPPQAALPGRRPVPTIAPMVLAARSWGTGNGSPTGALLNVDGCDRSSTGEAQRLPPSFSTVARAASATRAAPETCPERLDCLL